MSINRRRFLGYLGAALATPFTLTPVASAQGGVHRQPDSSIHFDSASVFGLSVASGDPSPQGVVLWTRINPEAYDPSTPLLFDVANDPDFIDIAYTGYVQAESFGPDRDYTLNIDLDGYLRPGRTYYYRFYYGEVPSRTGRARTLPADDQSLDRLRLAVLTCQDYTTGYYNAFHHLADESVDFVIHLGDFIYEYARYAGFEEATIRPLTLPSGGTMAMDLDDYRYLYRTYRTDPHLQRAMENHTFIITWDDHETADNAYWDYERDTLGAPYHPYSEQPDNAEALRQLRFDAQQAWIEYVPARVKINRDADHPFGYLQLYRQFRFGNLVDLFMTDSRTYRTQEPCKDGNAWDNYWCTDYEKDSQTMLGRPQRDWLVDGLSGSDARWKLWGNQTLLSQLATTLLGEQTAYANYDAWDGYQREREYIMRAVKDRDVDNLVVLTGDMHTSLASYLKVDYGNINNWDYGNLVGLELMTPSVTSPNLSDTIRQNAPVKSDLRRLMNGGVQLNNPHIKDFNSSIYGYGVLDIDGGRLDWTVYEVDKHASDARYASKGVYKTFRYDPYWIWLWEK